MWSVVYQEVFLRLSLRFLLGVDHVKTHCLHDWLQLPKLETAKKKAGAYHKSHCLHELSG